MAVGTICLTLPVVAAAVGLYLCERNNSPCKITKEIRAGSLESIAARAKAVEVKAAGQVPKLAPQFDGLDCFETFVGRL